jgi:hypothetical protein
VPIVGVVADANVLLSAVVGKAALRIFAEFHLVVHVTQFNAEEVAEYLPYMAGKYKLDAELVEMQWKLLPVRIPRASEHFLNRASQSLCLCNRFISSIPDKVCDNSEIVSFNIMSCCNFATACLACSAADFDFRTFLIVMMKPTIVTRRLRILAYSPSR